MAVPHNIKPELPYDPAILVLGIYSRKLKRYAHTNTFPQMFIAALFTTVPWKRPEYPSTGEWKNKTRAMEHYSDIKKEGSTDTHHNVDKS